MLTRLEILQLLNLLEEENVVAPSETFPFRITRKMSGYAHDKATAHLQAKLSIMLEVADRVEEIGKKEVK